MQLITRYFPDLTSQQIEQFGKLEYIYNEWNNKINVISRKDMDNFYEHHVLHSLSIVKVINFVNQTKIVDVGTGGGFPGIPLAIMFPEVNFHLVDSIGKKITVVEQISKALDLHNVNAEQIRIEKVNTNYDFVVSRAVTRFDKFRKVVRKNICTEHKNSIKNGIIYLKGGDFHDELVGVENIVNIYSVSNFFKEPFFETKKIIHLPVL